LENLLRGLLANPGCLGLDLTVFDPDFDVDGAYAKDLVGTLVTSLSALWTASPVAPPVVVEEEDEEPPAPVIPVQSKRSSRSRRSPAATT
jgi:arginase